MVSPYNAVPSSRPLLQGDVICWHKKRTKYKNSHSIVINADCDLDKNKFSGTLTCIPVLSVEDYFDNYWIKDKILKEISDIRLQLHTALNAALNRKDESAGPISQKILNEIIGSDNPASYFGEMDFKKEKTKLNCLKFIRYINDLSRVIAPGFKANTRKTKLSLLQAENTQRKQADVLKSYSDELQAQIKDDQQRDVVWLQSLPESSHVGYLASIRHIEPVEPRLIQRTRSDWLNDEKFGFRSASLLPYLKYGLAERFASQFHRVGFDEDYEHAREATLPPICKTFIGT